MDSMIKLAANESSLSIDSILEKEIEYLEDEKIQLEQLLSLKESTKIRVSSDAVVSRRLRLRERVSKTRSRRRAAMKAITAFGAIMVLAVAGQYFETTTKIDNVSGAVSNSGVGRSLFESKSENIRGRRLSENECKTEVLNSSLDSDYPALAMTLYILGLLYIFLGIAVVCDDYQLDLSTAVAGATFMAAGSSAPELATSLVTVVTTNDSTGLGTILGSAVFNLVVIVCLSGAFGFGPSGDKKIACEKAAGRNLPDGLFLDWRPMARDGIFYIISLILCVVFAATPVGHKSTNGKPGFLWWEGLILCTGYYFYVLTMLYDEQLMRFLQRNFGLPAHILCKIQNSTFGRSIRNSLPPSLGGTGAKHNAENKDEEMVPLKKSIDSKTSNPIVDDGSSSISKTTEMVDFPVNSSETLSNGESSPTKETFVPAQGLQDHREALDIEAAHKAALSKKVRFGNFGNFNRWTQAVAHKRMQGWIQERKKIKNDQSLHPELRKSLKGHMDAHTTPLYDRIEKLEKIVEDLQRQIAPIVESKMPDFRQLDEDPNDNEESIFDKIMDILAKPWVIAFSWTIPACARDNFNIWAEEDEAVDFTQLPTEVRATIDLDPTKPDLWLRGKYSKQKVDTWYKNSKRFLVSFVMSIIWIWLTSMGMVECAHRIGCHLGIGSFIMGLVVLSAGTSIPDALSSISVARQGEGDMAVANAVGSNVFNIFLGIGLPMMINQLVHKKPFVVEDKWPVVVTAVMLALITIIMFLTIWKSDWILTPKISWAMLPMFFIYIILNILLEAGTIPLYENL